MAKMLKVVCCLLVSLSVTAQNSLKEFANTNVEYISNLYKEVVKIEPGNFLLSPLSIQLVFGVLNGGAEGNTKEELSSFLHLPTDDVFPLLSKTLQVDGNYTIASANKIFLGASFNISDQFKQKAEAFHSEIQSVDFGQPETVEEINLWVEEKTQGKINNILGEPPEPNTEILLVNALYFQGQWVTEFSNVVRKPFYVSKKKAFYVDMMKTDGYFNFFRNPDGIKFLELPYDGNDVSLTLVLPPDAESLFALEDNVEQLLVVPKYFREVVKVAIPKFTIGSSLHLVQILQNLGVRDAFLPSANFSGIEENGSVSVNDVIQKTFIDVNEKGTVAAAATIITLSRIGTDEDLVFVADHPFLFYLRHKESGIFFVGRYAGPEQN